MLIFWRQMWKNIGLKYLVSYPWRTGSRFWDMHVNHALLVTLGFSNHFVSCCRKYYFHFSLERKITFCFSLSKKFIRKQKCSQFVSALLSPFDAFSTPPHSERVLLMALDVDPCSEFGTQFSNILKREMHDRTMPWDPCFQKSFPWANIIES